MHHPPHQKIKKRTKRIPCTVWKTNYSRVYLEVRGSAASGVLLKLQAREKIMSQARWLRIKQEARLQHPPLGLQVHKSATRSAAPGPVNCTAACGGATHAVQPGCGAGHASRASSCPKRPTVTALSLPDAHYPSFPSSASHAAGTGISKGDCPQQATGPFSLPSAPGEPVIASNNNR